MSKNGLACIYIKYKEVTMVFGNIDNLKEYSLKIKLKNVLNMLKNMTYCNMKKVAMK